MIRIENLTILFESFKITNLTIQIEEGNFHFLLGPTGSGKTLILESIIGLRKPKTGKIWIGDQEVQNLPPERRGISYVPQDLALFPHLTVEENILFGIEVKKLDIHHYKKYIHTLIEAMKIDHLLHRRPNHLSGGEKKRVALLRALAPKPNLLLLDEPLSGLDPSIKIEIQYLLKNLHTSFHPTTLCVTHDFEEAYFLADAMTIFVDGKVEQVGKKEEIFSRPKSKKVAQFLGVKNLYPAKIIREEDASHRWILEINGLEFSIPKNSSHEEMEVGRQVHLFIRPEEVMILREGKPVKDSLKRNIFEGKIFDILEKERIHTIYLKTVGGEVPFEISIPNYAFRNLHLSIGKMVQIALREESLWVMP